MMPIMKRRWPLLILVLMLLAGLLALLVWALRPTAVSLVGATRGEAVDAVFATGSVEPVVQLPVAPRLGARLVALHADEGQAVRRGQLLAVFEGEENEAQLAELAARQRQAELALARTETLVAQGFVAGSERDRVRADLDAIKAQVQRVRAQRAYTRLLAPADGTVLRRDGEVGQFIVAGQAVFQLGDPGQLRISAEVDEEDVPRVREGQPVLLRAAALGSTVFEGQVASITPKGDPVARSYRVRIALPQPPVGLRVGMTVDANLVAARRANALLLPAAAVQGSTVWQLVDGRARRLTLQIGTRGNGKVEVLGGLPEGAQLVLDAQGLQEGQRLRGRP